MAQTLVSLVSMAQTHVLLVSMANSHYGNTDVEEQGIDARSAVRRLRRGRRGDSRRLGRRERRCCRRCGGVGRTRAWGSRMASNTLRLQVPAARSTSTFKHSRPKRFGKTKSANLQMFMAKASVRGNDTSNVVEGTHAADQPARSLVESATCSVIKRSLSPSLALSPL